MGNLGEQPVRAQLLIEEDRPSGTCVAQPEGEPRLVVRTGEPRQVVAWAADSDTSPFAQLGEELPVEGAPVRVIVAEYDDGVSAGDEKRANVGISRRPPDRMEPLVRVPRL